MRTSNASPALRAFPSRISRDSPWTSHSSDRPASSTTFRIASSDASSRTSFSPSLIGERRWIAVPDTVRSRSSIATSSRRWWRRNVRSRGGCSGASGAAKVFSAAARPCPRQESKKSVNENPPKLGARNGRRLFRLVPASERAGAPESEPTFPQEEKADQECEQADALRDIVGPDLDDEGRRGEAPEAEAGSEARDAPGPPHSTWDRPEAI